MYLGLHLFPTPVFAHVCGVNFVIEVTNVTDDRAFFKALKHRAVAHIDVAGCRHEYVSVVEEPCIDILNFACFEAVTVRADNFKAIHASLHCANWIGFGDSNNHSLLTETLRRTLAHIAVANDECTFT